MIFAPALAPTFTGLPAGNRSLFLSHLLVLFYGSN
jgi:hypothetical protein